MLQRRKIVVTHQSHAVSEHVTVIGEEYFAGVVLCFIDNVYLNSWRVSDPLPEVSVLISTFNKLDSRCVCPWYTLSSTW